MPDEIFSPRRRRTLQQLENRKFFGDSVEEVNRRFEVKVGEEGGIERTTTGLRARVGPGLEVDPRENRIRLKPGRALRVLADGSVEIDVLGLARVVGLDRVATVATTASNADLAAKINEILRLLNAGIEPGTED